MNPIWKIISQFVLRNRIALLVVLSVFTAFMLYKAKDAQVSYTFAKLIPKDNAKYIEYENFKAQFGNDGNVMLVGIQTDRLFELDLYNDWYDLGATFDSIEGIEDVLSVAHLLYLERDTATRKFDLSRVHKGPAESQEQLDSLKIFIENLQFYEGLLFNSETKASIMAITFNTDVLNSEVRIEKVKQIEELIHAFEKKNDIELAISGFPYFRTYQVTQVASELQLFLVMALIFTMIILFILFRSGYAVIISLIVVAVGVIWSLGTLVIFGYKITLLTGLLPALIVVIGIPNCVYLLNKYHAEFKRHGLKGLALSRMIEKIGHVTLFTNLTTAIGFGVFYFTKSKVLEEFGAVAGLNIALLFVISLILIPTVFSFLPEPRTRHTGYLENKWLVYTLDKLIHWSQNRRPTVYAVSAVVVILALIGVTKLKATGFILDDVAPTSKVYQDLKFFEKNFNGVMPFEVLLNTNKKGAASKISTLKEIEKIENVFSEFDVFSKPVSANSGSKFTTQAYFNYNPKKYRLPNQFEKNIVASSMSNLKKENNLFNRFVDSTQSIARISFNVKDIGSAQMPIVLDSLNKRLNETVDTSIYDISFTGTSLTALEGYRYLINSLVNSVSIAFVLIAFIMGYLFRSVRMLLVSLLPNMIPLLVTAGIMGYFGISLKPSTVLIFSIAFGISVDDTIHFLAKYRQELFRHRWDISKTVRVALKETGISMIYTTLILFCGFSVFMASSFGGTVNLGLLTSIALIVAITTNLILLPSLLLSFEKIVDRKAMRRESLLEVFNEEEEIELEKLDIKK